MRKKIYQILLLPAAVSLWLILCASVAFAQCGADGTQPCGTAKSKIQSKPIAKPPTNSSRKIIKPQQPIKKQIVSDDKIETPGSVFEKTYKGQTLVISYIESAENLVFTLEAVNDFTNDLFDYSKIDLRDYAAIDIDINRDKNMDKNDIEIYTIGNELVDFHGNAGDGRKFKKCLLKSNFIGTLNQSRPHPVYEFTVPKSNVWNETGIFAARFAIAGKNYSVGTPGSYSDWGGVSQAFKLFKFNK